MGELVLFEHFRLDQRLHGIDLAVALFLHQLDLAKGTLADNLDRVVVFGLVLCAQESQILAFFAAGRRPQLFLSGGSLLGILELLLQFALSKHTRVSRRFEGVGDGVATFGYALGLA